MSKCGICQKEQLGYIYQNKKVCLRCDDLLFDIEIEFEPEHDENKAVGKKQSTPVPTDTRQKRS